VTAVRFDAASGRLRLDQAAFDRLVGLARGDDGAGPDAAALRDAGVVRDDGLHPLVADALRAVTEPVCRLRLALTDGGGRLKAGDGWLRADGAALLLDLPDEGLRDLVTLPADLLPAAIARVVRLGPRPTPEPEPLPVGSDLVAGLLAADPDERRRASDALAGVVRLNAGQWRTWRAQMTWHDPRVGLTGRAVQVVDAGPGLFLAASDGEQGTLWPTTPTAVWRILIRLLPDNDEVG
jgi:hypothetical protein